ncbi:3,4-dihydroxy-2-butanone-4-phosphate synthase [Dialister succinatiphilus]|uniref:3,4-dihydroxy-2-butanone-4-phosphate synthase n=1 Tax=Dialister succinatiphilus TaxID=487173 RepID=UPI00402962F9
MDYKFDSIEEIIEEIRKGHIVIMQDAESRENEGDYICAAEFATPENVNRMASEAKGVICMPMSEEMADALYWKHPGDLVNIECDYLGKYVEQLLKEGPKEGLTMGMLETLGHGGHYGL